ncbi:MAG TPA: hypothetical protein VG322_00845 [Candidatus Acidoferrales bacterium]|jgi:hypothetical protein|nr:hypothetical protein [Candidatus Acidoferrales bacterium]
MSKKAFGDILWAALTTVEQWESGECSPVGMHYRLLLLLEQEAKNPSFHSALRDGRAADPLFVFYRLLASLFEGKNAAKETEAPNETRHFQKNPFQRSA